MTDSDTDTAVPGGSKTATAAAGSGTPRAANTGAGSAWSAHQDPNCQRGDIAVRSLGVITTLIDVSVRATIRTGGEGAGARAGELAKLKKYSHWMLTDVNVVAFVLERNGTWGTAAATFVEKVAGAGSKTEAEKSAAVWRLVARLSVALQRGNGRYVSIMLDRMARKTGVVRSPAAAV